MNRSLLFAALFALAAVLPAAAAHPKTMDPTMVPKTDATLKGLTASIDQSKSRQADLTSRADALKKQIAALKAKAKNGKTDAGEQLPPEDLDTLNLSTAQLRYLQGAIMVEEVRQRDLMLSRDLYQASFFVATMMAEYIGDKGSVDDGSEACCKTKAKAYGLELPVGLLLNAQEYVVDQPQPSQ